MTNRNLQRLSFCLSENPARLLTVLVCGLSLLGLDAASSQAQPFAPQPFANQPFQNPSFAPPRFSPQPVQGRPAQIPYPAPGMAVQRVNPTAVLPASMRPANPVPTSDSIVNMAQRHPFCVIVGERIASQLIATDTVEEGPFREMIMGADVQGSQRTNARTSIDFIPNDQSVMLKVVLNGHTVSQTTSQVRQASIQSAGSIDFQVTKQIEFDGTLLRTWSPAAYMTIRQQNLGASTPMSPIPLLGPLANSIVMNAANQQKPMTEAIAAQRITQAVAPEFNKRLDEVLVSLNRKLNGEVKDWLETSQMKPSHIVTKSSHEAGLWGVAFETDAPASAGTIPVQPVSTLGGRRNKTVPSKLLIPVSTTGGNRNPATIPFLNEAESIRDRMVALVHESLIADLADRFELSGKDVPPALLSTFLGGAQAEAQGASLGTLILDKEQPISASITRGEFQLTIRASFKPIIGPEIPPHEVVFSFRPILNETEIVLKPELTKIAQVNPQTGGFLGAAGEGIIRGAIEQKLKDFTFPRIVNIPREEGKTPLPLRLQSLTLADGWLSIAYEPVVKTERPTWQSSDGLMEDAVRR